MSESSEGEISDVEITTVIKKEEKEKTIENIGILYNYL